MKRRVSKLLVFTGVALLAVAASAASLPYDESANAAETLHTGLLEAQRQHKHVLVIFGANWCPDCRALDKAFHNKINKLLYTHFVVVKVDVGNFDKNLELAQRYGNPIQKGIPAAVVLTANDKVLYATQAGELANARRMSESGISNFFSRVIAAHPQ